MTLTASAPACCWTDPFDDLAVGQAFTTPERRVSQDDVDAFAALSGDTHPQHVDAAWAARSPFGERIAHGLLVVSVAAGLVPFDPERVIALRRVGDVVFKRPVRPGDAIRVSGRIDALRTIDDDAGLVTLAWRVLDQDDRLVCKATVDVLWRRDAFVPIPL
jgi:3-hydroxybutyryl-CoA dehydratase